MREVLGPRTNHLSAQQQACVAFSVNAQQPLGPTHYPCAALILKRDLAVRRIYGKDDYFLGRSFDVFISRLRKILNKDPDVSIENVFKVGFILNVPVLN